MAYDYSKLKGKICEVYGTQGAFADAIGMSEHTISKKLTMKEEWKQNQIQLASKLLGIDDADIGKYFFTVKVQ